MTRQLDGLTRVALGMTVLGWSLIWAVGLSLVPFVPLWLAASVFFIGLVLIPFRGHRPYPRMRRIELALGQKTCLSIAAVMALAGLGGAETARAANDHHPTWPGAPQWPKSKTWLAEAATTSDPGGAGNNSTDLQSPSQDPKQWPMAPRDYANTRFSPLDQINTNNVGDLGLAWSFSLGADRGQEAAPLVINNTMYVVGPYWGVHPNQVFALDATTGDLKWSYAPQQNPATKGVACCDVVTRGLAYDNGKVFLATLDDYLVAIDAGTGRALWHTKLGDISLGETVTMAPLVVKGKVLVGDSGGELGVRGWVTAVDENSGQIAWRAYATGPDKDVLIGDGFKPSYKDMQGKDLGVTTWPADKWKIGGGTMWGWIQYDPQLNLIYYGTANPAPWNENERPGDNLWTATEFARDPNNGMAKGAYQYTPHDDFDYDEINESILLDLPVNSQIRKVLVHIGRNGYIYVIDRVTGRVYSASPYDTINATKGIDLHTGRPIKDETKKPSPGKTISDICPNADGEGLAAFSLVTAHASDLCAAPTPVHELEDHRGRLYRRHTLCRRHC